MNSDRLIEIIREEIKDAVAERELTDKEQKHKEDMVKSLKKQSKDLKKRYGDDWKSVMYAVATKQAKNKSEKDKENGSD